MLLARFVVPLCFHETFLNLWRQLRPLYLVRELGQQPRCLATRMAVQ